MSEINLDDDDYYYYTSVVTNYWAKIKIKFNANDFTVGPKLALTAYTYTAKVLVSATRRATIGDSAVAVAGPRASNSLRTAIHPDLFFFKRHLKHRF